MIAVGPKLLVGQDSPVRSLFSQSHFNKKVLGLVIDEAHCISQWGGEFRPEYSELSTVRGLLSPQTSVHATSATMPPLVLDHTMKSLLINPFTSFLLVLGNDRRNITRRVFYMKAGKSDLDCLDFLIPKDGQPTSLTKTMIFFDDIFQSMKARRWLLERLPEGFDEHVKNYNARRSDLARSLVMQGYQRGTIDVLLTAEAAGMVRQPYPMVSA